MKKLFTGVLIASFFITNAQVAISHLPSASNPVGTEVLPMVQGGHTKKVTVNQLRAGATVLTNGNGTTGGGTAANLGGSLSDSTNITGGVHPFGISGESARLKIGHLNLGQVIGVIKGGFFYSWTGDVISFNGTGDLSSLGLTDNVSIQGTIDTSTGNNSIVITYVESGIAKMSFSITHNDTLFDLIIDERGALAGVQGANSGGGLVVHKNGASLTYGGEDGGSGFRLVPSGGDTVIQVKTNGSGNIWQFPINVPVEGQTIVTTSTGGVVRTEFRDLPPSDFGTYTPSLNNTTNITSSTPIICHYTVTGDEVTVYGSAGVVTTLAVASELQISLPPSYPSDFAATTDCSGFGTASSAIATNAYVEGSTGSDVASLKFIGLSVGGSGTIFFSFRYKII